MKILDFVLKCVSIHRTVEGFPGNDGAQLECICVYDESGEWVRLDYEVLG